MAKYEDVIQVEGISKVYPGARGLAEWLRCPWAPPRPVRALQDVSFAIPGGQIVAVVGLNGAGKTTLLKVLCNLLLPTHGRVRLAGHALDRDRPVVRRRIGYVPSDERSFFWRISARSNLEFFAALYHVPPRVARRRIDELLGAFGLAGQAGGHFRDYSSGMRKRLAIIRGLIHDPQIIVLDEPTNSLDIDWDFYLREFMRTWVQGDPGRVVVWSTHRMEEVSTLCHRVIRLDRGRLVADAPVEAGFTFVAGGAA